MKKLFLSAFAVSLFILSFCATGQTDSVSDFLGVEEEVLPELEGPQRFTTERLHDSTEWKVSKDQVEIDKEPLRGQKYSIIPWGEQTPEAFLDVDVWLLERAVKDKEPDWKTRVRDLRHTELMGKFLSCQGTCSIYRGLNSARASYRSRVYEGDEVQVGADSYAWIYLVDGTLVRLSSETAVNFQEINVSREKFFVLLRLNQGHLFWHPKDTNILPTDLSPETDSGSLPIGVLNANLQFFERERFRASTDLERMKEVISVDEGAIRDQYKRINELRTLHQSFKDFKTHAMIVAPNVTVVATHTSFDFLSLLGGKSFVKKRSTREGDEMGLQLRGYLNTDQTTVTEESWIEVSENGRDQKTMGEVPGQLQVTELLTRRIKTFELARELWFSELTVPIIRNSTSDKKLGLEQGYVLWQKGLDERFKFLTEYTRRIETTNLRSIENLMRKTDRASTPAAGLSENHYRASLNHYLLGLKTRYTEKKMQVREMDDLQYYVWVLRHGKYKN